MVLITFVDKKQRYFKDADAVLICQDATKNGRIIDAVSDRTREHTLYLRSCVDNEINERKKGT